ncbi:MAG: hypothetical protein AAB339_02465, partial [Elusimicrobiota bacterium]
AGSTVNALIELTGKAVLQGDLNLIESSRLYPHTGSVLDARSSTLTLRGNSDIVSASSGTLYLHDADSWIVYEGTGADRGLSLSTGPYGGLRFNPSGSGNLTLKTITLDGSLWLQRGVALSSFTPVITLNGHLLDTGGRVDLTSPTVSTLRMGGSSRQRVVVSTGDLFWDFETASSSSVVLESSRLRLGGGLRLSGGVLEGGSSRISLNGDWRGSGGRFQADASTVSFESLSAVQTLVDTAGPNFNGLSVTASSVVFSSTFSAAVLSASSPTYSLSFSTAPGGATQAADLRLRGWSAHRMRLASSLPGTPWGLKVVSVSSVTRCDLSDSSASSGLLVHANDGLSLDSGGNDGWNFRPTLVLLSPGESFAEVTGKSGTPSTRTVGVPFTVSVRAVSSASGTVVNSSIPVSMLTSDPFDAEPAAKNLSSGATTFLVSLRTAEPLPRSAVLSALSAGAFVGGGSTVPVTTGAFDRMQVLLPGETPLPGSELGRTGEADLQTVGRSFSITARAVDLYWNLVAGAPADLAAINEMSASSRTIPLPVALSSGVAVFSSVYVYSTGIIMATATDQTNGAIVPNGSSTFSVFSVAFSSPMAVFAIPRGALIPTLGGAVFGTASDDVAVARVDVALRDNASGLYYDWPAETFSSTVPILVRTNVVPRNGLRVDWRYPIEDAKLSEGTSYYVFVKPLNSASFFQISESTFTFSPGSLSYGASDGLGSASIVPATAAACSALVSTLTFTAGAGGIGAGGGLALRLPEGWTRPRGLSVSSD